MPFLSRRKETKLVLELNGTRVLTFFGAALLGLVGIGVYFSIPSSRKVDAQAELRAQHLRQPGNAPPAVHAGVVEALRDFQDGYIRRDPKTLDAFMERAFGNSDDVLILGTNPSEWARGHKEVSDLIRGDWEKWGDFRFNADDSIVSSQGDVAWIAAAGTVHFKQHDRPVRFSATLTRHGNRWLFRQMQFQYDDSGGLLARLFLRR
jgi:SnoaL-like domain